MARLQEVSGVPQQVALARTGYGRALAAAGDIRRALAEHQAALEVLGTAPGKPILLTVIIGLALTALAEGVGARGRAWFSGEL